MVKARIVALLLAYVSVGVRADYWSDFNNDRGQSGNYIMYLCGSGQSKFKASRLQALLPHVWQNLQGVLADVKLGTASKHGFRSFFKTNTNQPLVRSGFQSIAEGMSLTLFQELFLRQY